MDSTGPAVIEGYVVHKANNVLRMTFQDGPGDPCAVGVLGGGDGKGEEVGHPLRLRQLWERQSCAHLVGRFRAAHRLAGAAAHHPDEG